MSKANPVHDVRRRYSDGTYNAGDLVIADVRNPFENPHSKGKLRPFVLVYRVDGHWCGMGLTTNPRHHSGAPRVAVPQPAAVGLRRDGFLWGDRLTSVSVLDIGHVIGRVDLPLVDAVSSLAGLEGETLTQLRRAALERVMRPNLTSLPKDGPTETSMNMDAETLSTLALRDQLRKEANRALVLRVEGRGGVSGAVWNTLVAKRPATVRP